jgi:hypothetical protein
VEGTKSVVLYQYAQGNGAINTNRYRIVNTTPIETGKTYTFSFFAKRVFDASAPDDSAKGNVQTFVPARLVANVWNVNSGQSVIAEDLGSTVFNPGINGTTDAPVSGDWTQYSINFTPTVTPSGNAAGTGNLFIQFRILDETLAFNPANVKYAVDNLSVTVPEPGSLALLSGAGLLALRRRRRD